MKINTYIGILDIPSSNIDYLCDIGMHRIDLSQITPTCIQCGCDLSNTLDFKQC